ncbi:30S ribosomal protein S6 [Spirochaeta cellobiosiphila]|uniref:30S ribosomal protein S6 n=1 Tax=Spirochaeta cellobiosiphila TaxID=504483 RepID=UPI0004108D81|nr:30S ribosomal protein S6 [Spirochaeta cellobiosiphila]
MRKYETVYVFNAKGDSYKNGLEAVKKIYEKNNATISKEEDMQERSLAYEVQKQDRGHYHLIEADIEPSVVIEIEKDLKLTKELLKYLFVVKG